MYNLNMWGERLKQLLEIKGMNQSDLAVKMGRSHAQINQLCNNVRKPGGKLLFEISSALSMTTDDLKHWLDYGTFKNRGIPVIAYISAGGGIIPESPDQYPIGEGIEFMELPPGYTQERADKEGIYGLKVRGDSMLPLLRDGSRLYIKPGNHIRKGDYVIFRDEEGIAFVKEIELPDADTIIFRSVGVGPTLIRQRSEITRLEKVWLIER